jgi:hypothetical protein
LTPTVCSAIRRLLNILPDPGVLHLKADQIGTTLLYQVTDRKSGSVWGTEVYTSDSDLGTASVHAGVLKAGQKGVIKVRVIGGQKSYQNSTHHGITSQAWGKWHISFTVEKSRR